MKRVQCGTVRQSLEQLSTRRGGQRQELLRCSRPVDGRDRAAGCPPLPPPPSSFGLLPGPVAAMPTISSVLRLGRMLEPPACALLCRLTARVLRAAPTERS